MFSCFRNLKVAFQAIHITKMPFYAVARGRNPGIFLTWDECQQQVHKYSGGKFRKFDTKEQALNYLKDNQVIINKTEEKEKIQDNTDKKPINHKNIELNSEDKNILAYYSDNECNDSENNDKHLLFDSDDDLLVNSAKTVENSNASSSENSRKRKSSAVVSNESAKKIKYNANLKINYEVVSTRKFGDYEFPINDNDYVIVYTDGACENNGKSNAAAGFGVYFNDNHPLNTSKPVEGRATNNCGELQAAIYALNIAKNLGIQKILINTDSKFLISSCTDWIWNWQKTNWKLKSGGVVKNMEEFKKLLPLLRNKQLNIQWNYTKGHSGIKGNEMADKLAKQGAEAYKISHKKGKQ